MQEKPLFPFGYGLSYSDFRLSDINFDNSEMRITGTVCNIGTKAKCKSGKATVQVYIRYPKDKNAPKKTLVGISKVDVPVNGESEFCININKFWLRQFNETTGEMEEPKHGDKFILQVGFSSDDKNLDNFKFKYIER